ncbi:hypothetical protein SAMN00790413_05670 [Deinococcus hopiensis KR-140]|uniref:Transposase DDE domain-containing protein n=1 Tax=Deinococcus hopiensis KR-140 TaxID=695939 RepID=A0A1W1UDH9_9DEIO|nr:hypothetical protein SAMN00790413_05670 [Deinococcus hopiensis KR-140]
MVDASGIPLAVHTESASPAKVTLVYDTLEASFGMDFPKRRIGDKAYDSDPLDTELAALGIEMTRAEPQEPEEKDAGWTTTASLQATLEGGTND